MDSHYDSFDKLGVYIFWRRPAARIHAPRPTPRQQRPTLTWLRQASTPHHRYESFVPSDTCVCSHRLAKSLRLVTIYDHLRPSSTVFDCLRLAKSLRLVTIYDRLRPSSTVFDCLRLAKSLRLVTDYSASSTVFDCLRLSSTVFDSPNP